LDSSTVFSYPVARVLILAQLRRKEEGGRRKEVKFELEMRKR
jgi:hypothetical protein